eukprot:413968-Rhodomonas_salina.1
MSGTDIPYAPIILRARYDVSGTDVAYAPIVLGARYEVSSTMHLSSHALATGCPCRRRFCTLRSVRYVPIRISTHTSVLIFYGPMPIVIVSWVYDATRT